MKYIGRIMVGILIVFALAACSGQTELQHSESDDIKSLVETLTLGDFTETSASITSHELIINEQGKKETVYDLPDDEFFVSIAPFVSETHPCDIHSLTGCQGELVEEEFDIVIVDENGEVILDDTLASYANGFIDLWLPRNQTFHVTIEQDGKMAEQQIPTFEGDQTCITTMQLVERVG